MIRFKFPLAKQFRKQVSDGIQENVALVDLVQIPPSEAVQETGIEIGAPFMDDGSLNMLISQPNIVQRRSGIEDTGTVILMESRKLWCWFRFLLENQYLLA